MRWVIVNRLGEEQPGMVQTGGQIHDKIFVIYTGDYTPRAEWVKLKDLRYVSHAGLNEWYKSQGID